MLLSSQSCRGYAPSPATGRSALLFTAILLLAGCTSDAPRELEARAETPDQHPDGADLKALGTLMETTPGGTLVRLTFSPDPPLPGPVHLEIELHPVPEDHRLVSVDLVSPEMPAHGVSRHQAEPTASPRRFSVNLSIPMEGLWDFYVNLDVGLDAATFAVPVPSGLTDGPQAHSQHHGMHGPDGDDQHRFP